MRSHTFHRRGASSTGLTFIMSKRRVCQRLVRPVPISPLSRRQYIRRQSTTQKMRVRPYGVPGNVGTIVPLTGTGARTAVDSLPLFNVWRVDFAVAVGRPNRKYLRGPIAEGDQASGLISPSITSTILTTNYINPLLALGVLVDTQGNSVTSGNAWPYVGMRQLRRGSKRKTTPVI